ncbi:ATP-binding protein [Sphingomonas baiyangensis]|uniref:histidine kinase n=1 Tax=Sphingomonas baiyangensis TaxID=2572576 RepID=A0A4U1L8M5_9SPHN|nr:ATP-binding protein [Sphingomonas baiyangensis]TKD53321.1 PAS domain S-box protein [Sphingomonas baiyangensis]
MNRPVLASTAPSPLLFVALAVLIPAILVAFAWFLGAEYSRADDARRMARDSGEVTATALGLRAALRQAETAQRGYVLTRDPRFLVPFQPARSTVDAEVARYRSLTGDAAVGEIVAAKFEEMDQVLSLGAAGEWERATERIADGEGLALMTRIERLMDAQIARSDREIARASARFEARSRSIQRQAWALVAVVTAALLVGLVVLWRLRAQRWAASLAAQAASARHRAILESTSDAIIIFNPSGSIEQINAATARLLGYRPAEIERRDVSTILDIAAGEGTFHERLGASEDGIATPMLVDRLAVASDGRHVPVDISLGLMPLPDGLHVVASLRDVSERKAVERMKSDFIATVSHELRTPLTSVVGSLGLLRAGSAGDLPEMARELVEIAENNARRLIRLTNDILDLDKLSQGAMTLDIAEADLGAIAAETTESYRGSAAARGIGIAVETHEAPLIVAADRQRLIQAAGNLLSNAVRHAPERSSVTIATRSENGRALLTITDEGAGVPTEFRDRIFDRFGQAPADQASGTGLGLAIVREIVGAHNGSVWYEDAPGGGARFVIALDRIRHASRDRLLLLSQDAETIARISAIAEADGAILEPVATIKAVERAARSATPPALILFDLDMAAERQDEFWAWLNRDPDLGPAPCAIVSQALLETEAALPFDIIAWFAKPIDEAAIQATLSQARARRRQRSGNLILQVEDDRDLGQVVVAAMAGEGEVLTAPDLATARRMLREREPDIVILDLALPDGSGVDLLPDLVDTSGRPIPVIVHSAQAVSAELVGRAAAVVTKSRTTLPELRSIIRKVVDHANQEV